MTARLPLYVNGSGNIREQSAANVLQIVNRVAYLYGTDPSVTLSVVASSGNLTAMTQQNKAAGAYATNSNTYPSAGVTPNITTVTDTYDKINQSAANTTQTANTDSYRFPLYLDDNANLRAMTRADFYDTFIYPAIPGLVDGTKQPGMYRVASSTTVTGCTLVSNTPIYVDEQANTSAYTAGGIPETLDQGTTINSYYLHKGNAGTAPSITVPLAYDGANISAEWSAVSFDDVLKNSIRHVASEVAGYKIRYNTDGDGTQMGVTMADTILDGTGRYERRFVNDGDYRSQEFPNGSPISNGTYSLRVQTI